MPEEIKILIVDDDPDVVDFCSTVLKTKGYKILSAYNGKEGLALTESENPNLIILDIMMEEADSGLKMAETLGGKTPILLLSSIAGASDQVFDTGRVPVKEWLDKPILPETLIRKVQALLDHA